MPLYEVEVIETRNYNVTCRVEAGSIAEAVEKAESGDTVSEDDAQLSGVSDRFVVSEDDVKEVTT